MIKRLEGIALTVDKTGKILTVLFNDVNENIKEGGLFPTIVAKGEFAAALDFLNRLKNNKMLVDIPLSLTVKDETKSFYFTGVEKSDYFVLIASNNQGMDASIYDEIAKVNNELANQVRESVKSNFQREQDIKEPQLEEFTKLNNELVNTQRQLSKSNRQLEILNEQKNQMIGIAAHDLRNPLGVISGYIQFVKGTSSNLQPAQVQMLDKAIETSKNMTGMLEELLDMSELESGNVNLKFSVCDIQEILKENIQLNQVIADAKQIKIHFESVGSIEVNIDKLKIEQVINNFISNAIKYSHSDTNINVSLSKEHNTLTVSVRDQGQGIPQNELSGVFEPFKTTSVKATGGEKSTGLGLSIAKKLVEAHHGEIGVKSQANIGTEFYFKLPITNDN